MAVTKAGARSRVVAKGKITFTVETITPVWGIVSISSAGLFSLLALSIQGTYIFKTPSVLAHRLAKNSMTSLSLCKSKSSLLQLESGVSSGIKSVL